MVWCVEKLNVNGKLKCLEVHNEVLCTINQLKVNRVMLFITILDLDSLFAEIKLHKLLSCIKQE